MKADGFALLNTRLGLWLLLAALVPPMPACTNSESTLKFAPKVRASWSPATVEVRQGEQATAELGLLWVKSDNGFPSVRFSAPSGVHVNSPAVSGCTLSDDNCSARLGVTIGADAFAAVADVLVTATATHIYDNSTTDIETATLQVRVIAADSAELVVEVEGNGRVTSSPEGLDCNLVSQRCARWFDSSTTTTLLATPDPGWRVELADGDCQVVSGVGARTLSVVLRPKGTSRCRVRFTADRQMEISVSGPGTVQLGNMVCPPGCTVEVGASDSTMLLAQAASGARFVGWAGDCSGAAEQYTLQWLPLGRAQARCTANFQFIGSSSTGNLVQNSGFEEAVAAGSLPTLAGFWQGDATNTVPAEGGIAPHGGASMLKFIATGAQATATLVSSQMWQIVDLRAWSAAIDAGSVRVDASAWFNRVTGGPGTDRRFDLRVLAFDTTDAGVPMRYQANAALAVGATSVDTTGAAWQQARTQLMLPPQTRVVLVEIYAYEDVLNDAVAPEFEGHYADDVVLTLTLP